MAYPLLKKPTPQIALECTNYSQHNCEYWHCSCFVPASDNAMLLGSSLQDTGRVQFANYRYANRQNAFLLQSPPPKTSNKIELPRPNASGQGNPIQTTFQLVSIV
jgi:hypothetical protein